MRSRPSVSRIAPGPMGPALAVVVGAGAITRAALVVVALWLLVGVFVLVGVEEILGSLPAEVDVAARATIPALGLLVVVGGVGETIRLVLERALRMRQVRRLAASDAPMPPAAERAQLVRGAIGPLRALLGVLGGASLLAAPILLALADGETAFVVAGIVTLVAGVLLLLAAIRLLAPAAAWWGEQLAVLARAWPRFRRVDRPTTAGSARGRGRGRGAGVRRLDAALVGALAVGFAVVVLGLFLRQQCRTCDPVSYDPWGERLVDGVATIGLVLFVGVLALLLLRGVAWIVEQAVRELLAARAADAGTLRRSAWLDGAVGTPRSLELVALVVGVVGMATGALVVASGVDPEVLGEPEERFEIVRGWAALAPAAVALLAAALVLGIAGARTSRAWRAVIWTDLRDDPMAGRLEGGSGSGSSADAHVGGVGGGDGGGDDGGDGGGGGGDS